MLKLYDSPYPSLRLKQEGFIKEIITSLKDSADFIYNGIKNTNDGVAKVVKHFEKNKCSLILVVLPTYSPSLITTPVLKSTGIPVVIFNTAKIPVINNKFSESDYMENHGMHGVQDLCNTLIRAKTPFNIVTGHYKDKNALNQLKEYIKDLPDDMVLRSSRSYDKELDTDDIIIHNNEITFF